MKRTLTLTCAILTVALLTAPATADMYVRNTAAGAADGSDWDNAFGSIDAAWAAMGSPNAGETHNIYIEKSLTVAHSYTPVAHYLGYTSGSSGGVTITQFGGLTPGSGTAYTQTAGDISRVSNATGDGYNITQYTSSDATPFTIDFNDMEISGSASAAYVQGRAATVSVNTNRSIFASTAGTLTDYVLEMGGSKTFELDMDRCLVKGTADMAGGVYVRAQTTYYAVVNASNTAIVDTGYVGIYAYGGNGTNAGGGRIDLDSVTISGLSGDSENSSVAIRCGTTGQKLGTHNTVAIDNVLLYPDNDYSYLFRNDAPDDPDSNIAVTGSYNAFYDYKDVSGVGVWTDPDSVGQVTYAGLTSTDDAPDGDPGVGADGFHLLATSLMIDAGATALSVDYDGEDRPYPEGGSYDIGADEYVPEPATMGLLGLGFAGMAVLRKRRRRA